MTGIRNAKTALKKLWGPPGLTTLMFLVMVTHFLFGGYVNLAHNLLKEPDTFWLIKTGQYILAHHQIPDHNIFGLDAAQKNIPLVCYQWLFEALLGSFYNILGLHGVVLVVSLLAGFILLVEGLWLYDYGFKPLPEVLVPLLFSFLILEQYSIARPFVISYLFLVILLKWLRGPWPSAGAKLFWIPLLFLLWANLHLGFIAGIAILATDALLNTRDNIRHRLLLLLFSGLATFINPYGPSLYGYLANLAQGSYMNNHIIELQSINFHSVPPVLFAVLLSLICGVAAFRDPEIPKTEKAWFLVGFGLALYSFRHLYFLGVFALPLIASATRLACSRWQQNPLNFKGAFLNSSPDKPFYAVLLILFVGFYLAKAQSFPAAFPRENVHRGLMTYLKNHPINEKILTSDGVGSSLLYFSAARSWIDTRMDMYGDDYVRNICQAYGLEENWQSFMDANRIHYVVYPISAKNYILILSEIYGWKALYWDNDVVLLSNKNVL